MNEIEMYKTEQRASDSLRMETRNVRMRPRRKHMVENARYRQVAESADEQGLADSLNNLTHLYTKHPEIVQNLSGRISKHYQLRIVGGRPHIARMPSKRKRPFDDSELRRQSLFAEATRMARSDMKDPIKSEYWKSQVGEKYKTPVGAACAFYYNCLKQKEELRLKKAQQDL